MPALSAMFLIFSFQFSLFFFHVRQPGSTVRGLPNIGHRTLPKICVGTFFVRSVQPRQWFWIDSNGKVETGYPVEGLIGCEFPAICNHCGVMAASSRNALKFWQKFLRFLEIVPKRPLTVKFSKFCSESFHRDTNRHSCVQISGNLADEKSAKSCVFTGQ